MQEIISKRSKTSKSYDLGNGNVRMESFMHPIHYKNGENYEDINTNIEFESGFGHKIKKADYNLRFNKKSLRFGFSKNVYLDYILPTENRVVNGDTCTYVDAWTQTDLEYIVKNEGIKNNIILKDDSAPSVFNFPVSLKGCILEVVNNSINIIANESIIGIIPAPFAMDSNGANGEVLISYTNDTITFTANPIWLSTSSYPVTIDPSTYQVGVGGDDGYTSGTSGLDTTNTYIQVGATYEAHSLFARFTNVDIPKNASITSANLSYLSYANITGTTPTTIYFDASDNSIAPTSYATYTGKTTTTASVAWSMPNFSSGVWYDSPEIKTIIQELVNRSGWASGNAMTVLHKNNGAGSYAYRQIRSYNYGSTSAPKLVVTYSSGTQYTLTITPINTTSLTLQKSTSKIISSINIVSQTVAKAINKSMAVINTISATVKKSSTKTVNTISTAIANGTKLSGKVIASVVTTSSSNSKFVSKMISSVVTTSNTLSKGIYKVIVAINTLSVNSAKVITKTISTSFGTINNLVAQAVSGVQTFYVNIANTITTSMALSKNTNKTIATINTSTAAIKKAAYKNIIVTTTNTMALAKWASKNIASTINVSNILLKRANKNITTAIISTETLVKSARKNIVSTITSSNALLKRAYKSIISTASTVASVRKTISKNIVTSLSSVISLASQVLTGVQTFYINILTTNTTTARITKNANKHVSSATASMFNLTKNITKTVSTSIATAHSLIKSISKTIATNFSMIVNVAEETITGAIIHYLNILTENTTTTSISKIISKRINAATATSLTLRKLIDKYININVSVIMRLIRGGTGLFYQCYMYLINRIPTISIKERTATITIKERTATITVYSLEVNGMAVAGNTVRVQCEFKTFPTASVLADPSAITFKTYDGEGRQVGDTVNIDSSNRLSLGVYYYDYLIPRGYRVIYAEFSGTLEGSIITGKETICIE